VTGGGRRRTLKMNGRRGGELKNETPGVGGKKPSVDSDYGEPHCRVTGRKQVGGSSLSVDCV